MNDNAFMILSVKPTTILCDVYFIVWSKKSKPWYHGKELMMNLYFSCHMSYDLN